MELKFCPTCNKNMIRRDAKCCFDCEGQRIDKEAARQKRYDRLKRENANVYKDRRWKPSRKKAIKRDAGQCVLCIADDSIGFVDEVHHIVPIEDDLSLAYNVNNLACLCRYHHKDVVHKEYDASPERKKKMQNKLRMLIGVGVCGIV